MAEPQLVVDTDVVIDYLLLSRNLEHFQRVPGLRIIASEELE